MFIDDATIRADTMPPPRRRHAAAMSSLIAAAVDIFRRARC